MHYETHARSIAKALSWRFWATLTTAGLVFAFAGETSIALAAGGLEVVVNVVQQPLRSTN